MSLDGAQDKKQVVAPMFEHEIFRKQMYRNEKSTCDSVGIFWPTRSHSTPHAMIWRHIVIQSPGNCPPLASFVTPLVTVARRSVR